MRNKAVMMVAAMAMCLSTVVLGSCQDNRAYHRYQPTDIQGWSKADVLTYDVEPLRDGQYSVDVCLRRNETIPFSKIVMLMETTIYPSKEVHTDTISYPLYDSKGRTMGNGGVSTTSMDWNVSSLTLRNGDSLHISLRHCMQQDMISGIAGVGVQITRK